jgi:hypothetical protein
MEMTLELIGVGLIALYFWAVIRSGDTTWRKK